ncbi:MAG: hypothetical protein ACFBZ8_05835 [Opitutales bacterium]
MRRFTFCHMFAAALCLLFASCDTNPLTIDDWKTISVAQLRKEVEEETGRSAVWHYSGTGAKYHYFYREGAGPSLMMSGYFRVDREAFTVPEAFMTANERLPRPASYAIAFSKPAADGGYEHALANGFTRD